MKLTMKNALSFEKAEGYLDDPAIRSTDDVREQLSYWHGILEQMDIEGKLPGDLVYLSSFLKSLADGEVEYEEPLEEYTFLVGFEYYKRFRVVGKSAEDARQMAKYRYAEYKERLPKLHDGLMLGICYLEDDVHSERIIEE